MFNISNIKNITRVHSSMYVNHEFNCVFSEFKLQLFPQVSSATKYCNTLPCSCHFRCVWDVSCFPPNTYAHPTSLFNKVDFPINVSHPTLSDSPIFQGGVSSPPPLITQSDCGTYPILRRRRLQLRHHFTLYPPTCLASCSWPSGRPAMQCAA